MVKQMKETETAWKAKALKEEAIQWAVRVYQDGLKGPESSRPGLQTACAMEMRAIKQEAGIDIKISHHTVQAWLNGMYKHF